MARFAIVTLLYFLLASSWALAQHASVPRGELQADPRPRMFILSVGVSEFHDAFWPQLKWTVSDARAVAAKLGSDSGYRIERYVLSNAEANLANIRRVMTRIERRARPGDVVVAYVSTHGSLVSGRRDQLEQVIVVHDTVAKDLGATGLAHAELRAWLERLASQRNLLILATCHSGVGKSKLPADIERLIAQRKGTLPPLQSVSSGYMILAASSRGEVALESDQLRADVYSKFFLEGLDVADRNRDGVVSALEAHDYAREMTYRFTEGRQRPTLETKMIGDADIPLAGRRTIAGLPVLAGYDAELEGLEVGVNSREKASLPLGFPLTTGRNTISLFEANATEPFAAFQVSVRPGEVISVQRLLQPPPYLVAAAVDSAWYQQRGLRRLAKNRAHQGASLRVYRQWAQLRLGLFYYGANDQSATPLPNLKSKLSLQATGVRGAYSMRVRHRHEVFGLLGAGITWGRIALSDPETREDIVVSDRAPFWDAAVGYRYQTAAVWLHMPSLFVTYGYRSLALSFAELGDAKSFSKDLSVGMAFELGAPARRIR